MNDQLLITLKNKKKNYYACLWRHKFKQSFSSTSAKLITFRLFFNENEDYMKTKIE